MHKQARDEQRASHNLRHASTYIADRPWWACSLSSLSDIRCKFVLYIRLNAIYSVPCAMQPAACNLTRTANRCALQCRRRGTCLKHSSEAKSVPATAYNSNSQHRYHTRTTEGQSHRCCSATTVSQTGQGPVSQKPCTLQRLPLPLLAAAAVWTISAGTAHAGEALHGSAFDLFREWLDQVEALGPWGAVLFVATVAIAEMVPLFPTQPLSLAGGLLFGAGKGALLMLLGVTTAAYGAFSLSRGVGKSLAKKVVDAEMSDGGEKGGAIQSSLKQVQEAIDSGGPWKQFVAIVLLRLTPVVPFSASNYLLGLTPIQQQAFIGGTLVGMSFWSVLYTSLGAASRRLLDSGTDISTVFEDLVSASGKYTQDVAVVALVAGVIAAGVWIFTLQSGGSDDKDSLSENVLEKEKVLQNRGH